ncbi:LysR family transcriptional regulator [Variovorax paradoxus]|uniref:LysR family transcriptional regulator n=1 Tax=Variovorax paradoxus TaxID=34073 RepID=A0A6I6HFS5_VARPD|nr:LysR family transcriptional regulator [Variovorax paradoxus]QGW81298.1 LysR family transcriptional regulator [Variovorax paradoxus]
MRNLNLDQVQTLIAIADLGTLAAAAKALHFAPPTVSLHIRELESRLGAVLVERGRRQARLTPAGLALVEGGRKLLASAEELSDQVRRKAEGREGVVRIGSSAGVSAHLLPALLARLSKRSPGVDVTVSILSSVEAIARLQAGTLDIGIVAMPQAPSAGVQLIAWRNDPMVAILPRSWKAPKLVTPQWLAERAWISFDPGTQMYRLIAAWFGQAGLNPQARMHLNYPEAIKSLVAAGHAAAILPFEPHSKEAMADELVVRHLKPMLSRPLGLAFRVTKSRDNAVQSVLQTLGEFG